MDEKDLKNLTFSLDNLEFASAEGQKDKSFEGLAYSGKIIEDFSYFGRVIVDLEDVTFEEQIPIFLNHNPTQIAGHGILETSGRDVSIKGKVFSYDDGSKVIKMSESGLKWKLSIGWSAKSAYEIPEGEEKVINGDLVSGPIVVFKQPFIAETSFVPLPADRKTSVSVFSKFFKKNKDIKINKEIEEMGRIEDLELELKEMKETFASATEELTAANEQLTNIALEEKAVLIEAKFAGLEIGDEDKEMLTAAFMSDDEVKIKMADRMLGSFSAPVVETPEVPVVEVPKVELPKELAKEHNFTDSTKTETEGVSLRDRAKELMAKNPALKFSKALVMAKSL